MSKTIMSSLLLAIAGIFALNLRADSMFYIGETGYDSWTNAYNAAQNGDTITVGQNATMKIDGGKTVTIDLAGGTLGWEGAGYTWGTITVVDSDGGGRLTLVDYSRNVSGATVDLSALTADQLALNGAGLFWTSAATVIKFPSGMALADCTPRLGNKAVDQVIVVEGVTYIWDGSSWVADAPGHDITITAPQNGTLETSVTNDVAAGTIVTVTATPAAGYLLVSVTTNGAALAGTTFEMPSEDVTVAATFEDQESPTRMFYIGGTGYDSWAAAYAAAQNGATITVGANAEISGTVGSKTFILDLRGRSVNIISGWWYGTVTVIDSAAPAGRFVVVPENGGNFSQSKVDFSALVSTQVSGKFQLTDASSIMTFPSDRSFEDCTSAVTGKSAGTRIVVQGVTYTWNGTSWESDKKGVIIYVL